MKKQLLLFDFDGTIADTFHHIVDIANRLSEEFNFKPILPDEVHCLKHKSVEETIDYLKVPLLKIPNILLRARTELHKDISSIEPIKDLTGILKHLKSLGYQMGIITTNSSKNVLEFLSQHQLDFFDFISSTSKVFGKSRSLKRLIKKHKLNLDEVFYIGDEIRDILAAQKAGVEIVAVTWGFNSETALMKHAPNYLINNPIELIQICSNPIIKEQ